MELVIILCACWANYFRNWVLMSAPYSKRERETLKSPGLHLSGSASSPGSQTTQEKKSFWKTKPCWFIDGVGQRNLSVSRNLKKKQCVLIVLLLCCKWASELALFTFPLLWCFSGAEAVSWWVRPNCLILQFTHQNSFQAICTHNPLQMEQPNLQFDTIVQSQGQHFHSLNYTLLQ